jgi:hypothetical protein
LRVVCVPSMNFNGGHNVGLDAAHDVALVLVKRDPLQSRMTELARAGVRREFSP